MKIGDIVKVLYDMEHENRILKQQLSDAKYIAYRLEKGNLTYALREDEIAFVKNHLLGWSGEECKPFWHKTT